MVVGRRALVTGASGGLGREIAIKLASEGCTVSLLGRKNLNEVREKIKSSHILKKITSDEKDFAAASDSLSFFLKEQNVYANYEEACLE